MIKMIHFADLHLGSANYGPRDKATGLPGRQADVLAALDVLVEDALAQKVDLVVFAGDAFRTREPSPTHLREFAKRIICLASAGIQVVLVTGNHDTPAAAGKATAFGIFRTVSMVNVHVMTEPGMKVIETHGGPVQIVALPWSNDEPGAPLWDEEQGLSLDPSVPAILVAHCTVGGSTYGSERSILLGNDPVLPLELLARRGFDYIALGHLHKHQALADDPPVVYSGSVDRVDFGEEHDTKGYVFVNVGSQESGLTHWEFIPLVTRRYVTVEVNASLPNPTADIITNIEDSGIDDAVVRLIIHATAEVTTMIRRRDIESALSGAYHVTSITYDIERDTRRRLDVEGYSEITDLGPAALLEKYFQVKGTKRERRDVLLDRAEDLILEGEGV